MSNPWLLCCTVVLGACQSLAAPELPERVEFGGVTFRAELTVVRPHPTEVRMRVLVTNHTSEAVVVTFWAPPCSFRPVVYGHVVSRVIYLGFGVVGVDCALGSSMTIDPAKTGVLPDEPQFVVRDRMGDEFEPGQYFFAARLGVGTVGAVRVEGPVELGTRTIDVR
jgi:hypothetical protein